MGARVHVRRGPKHEDEDKKKKKKRKSRRTQNREARQTHRTAQNASPDMTKLIASDPKVAVLKQALAAQPEKASVETEDDLGKKTHATVPNPAKQDMANQFAAVLASLLTQRPQPAKPGMSGGEKADLRSKWATTMQRSAPRTPDQQAALEQGIIMPGQAGADRASDPAYMAKLTAAHNRFGQDPDYGSERNYYDDREAKMNDLRGRGIAPPQTQHTYSNPPMSPDAQLARPFVPPGARASTPWAAPGVNPWPAQSQSDAMTQASGIPQNVPASPQLNPQSQAMLASLGQAAQQVGTNQQQINRLAGAPQGAAPMAAAPPSPPVAAGPPSQPMGAPTPQYPSLPSLANATQAQYPGMSLPTRGPGGPPSAPAGVADMQGAMQAAQTGNEGAVVQFLQQNMGSLSPQQLMALKQAILSARQRGALTGG